MTLSNFRVAALALGVLLASIAHAQTAAPLASGLDRAGMDPTVRPQDDLFDAMNGHWIKATEIPAGSANWGSFHQLRDVADHRVRDLIEGLDATHPAPGTPAQKVNDFFRSFLDTAAIDKAGLAPVLPSLRQIDAVRDTDALLALMGRWQGAVRTPLSVHAANDIGDGGDRVADLWQDGLGLPDRDYYTRQDERLANVRTQYADYLATLFTLAGTPADEAALQAARVIALERRIAEAQWPRDRNRDPRATHNPMSLAALAASATGVDWARFAAEAHLPANGVVIVAQPSYVAALAGLIRSEPLATWKLYLRAARLDGAAIVLPAAFREASYRFHDVALSGARQDKPRWQRGVSRTNAALGEAVGQLYVAQHFPPAAKARVAALADNVRRGFDQSIDGLAWMAPETRKEAHVKLSRIVFKIGYPETWRDYSALVIKLEDALGNLDRADAFEQRRDIARVGHKADRGEWGMTPQTVNAYYNPSANEVVFPAAILQPPFFDPTADDAVNYGAIGAMLAHQVSDAFDDAGSQFDGDGRLRPWWSATDHQAFDAATRPLVAQYEAYAPVPGGQHVNGKLTWAENIADVAGLQVAYKAWKLSLEGRPSPVIDGFTGEQRFVYGYAQAFRDKVRDQRALQLLTVDPHSPGRFRVDGAAINADVFHDAFHTKPGDAMWKAPEDRVRLW